MIILDMKPEWKHPYRKAVALQELLQAKAESPESTAKDAASCACAWEKLERLKRDMAGKADPARFKSSIKRSKNMGHNGPILEPVELPVEGKVA